MFKATKLKDTWELMRIRSEKLVFPLMILLIWFKCLLHATIKVFITIKYFYILTTQQSWKFMNLDKLHGKIYWLLSTVISFSVRYHNINAQEVVATVAKGGNEKH